MRLWYFLNLSIDPKTKFRTEKMY